MSETAAPRWLETRTRSVRWALGACAGLASIAAAVWFGTPRYVDTWLLPKLWQRWALTVTAEQRDFSIIDGAAAFRGVQVFDGDEEVLSAQRIEVRVSLRALFDGRTVLERVVVDEPVVHAYIGTDGRTNLARILSRNEGRQTEPRPATLWKDVSVHGGTVEWDDRSSGVSLRILDIETTALDMQTGDGERQDLFGQITLDANLEQPDREPAPLAIVYWETSPEALGPDFVARAALTAIDLDGFADSIDTARRATLGVDHLDLVVAMDVREGVIRRGEAVATSPERARPLTLSFGGPLAEPIFDRSSQLVSLAEFPFTRLGRLGDVAWVAGVGVAGGGVGVVAGVARGDLPAAGKSAVRGAGGGVVEALGQNALEAIEAVGRALGVGEHEQEEPRDAAAIHAQRREQLLTAQRRAEEVWSPAPIEPAS
jgi:hypothetical protein